MKKVLHKRILAERIKFLKKFEMCKIHNHDEEELWRISTTLSMRSQVTDRVKLISKTMCSVKMGKYKNTPANKVPKHEIERRRKETERRNKYNVWMDLNDIEYMKTTVPIFQADGKTIKRCDHRTLARYMVCDNF